MVLCDVPWSLGFKLFGWDGPTSPIQFCALANCLFDSARTTAGLIDQRITRRGLSLDRSTPSKSRRSVVALADRFAGQPGTFLTAQIAERAMVAAGTGGSIIVVTSTCLRDARAIQRDQGRRSDARRGHGQMLDELGMRVNAIAPGWVETRFTADYLSEPASRAAVVRTISVGRLAQPSDVAGAAIYSGSDESSYVTGVVLKVDGDVVLGRDKTCQRSPRRRALTMLCTCTCAPCAIGFVALPISHPYLITGASSARSESEILWPCGIESSARSLPFPTGTSVPAGRSCSATATLSPGLSTSTRMVTRFRRSPGSSSPGDSRWRGGDREVP
jgi:hypothetical protein